MRTKLTQRKPTQVSTTVYLIKKKKNKKEKNSHIRFHSVALPETAQRTNVRTTRINYIYTYYAPRSTDGPKLYIFRHIA